MFGRKSKSLSGVPSKRSPERVSVPLQGASVPPQGAPVSPQVGVRTLLKGGLMAASLLALAATVLVVAAPSASAVPTPGGNSRATARLLFVVPTPATGATPSLRLDITPVNSQPLNCSASSQMRLLANDSSSARSFRTNYDPSPRNIANNDGVACRYNVTITPNLDDCTFTLNRGGGATDLTGTSFTLEGDDSPNFATGAGAFIGVAIGNTITITPDGCSSPATVVTQRLVQIRNIENTQRYRVNYSPFGNCSSSNTPLEVLGVLDWSFAVLDLRCNWNLTVAPLDDLATFGCTIDALVYFEDGTLEVDSDGELFIHQIGNFAGIDGKRINRIDLSTSSSTAGLGVCEEFLRLTVNVELVASLDPTLFSNELVSFTVEPLDNSQSSACTQRSQFQGSVANPAVMTVVKSPRGSSGTCAYKLTAAATSTALSLAGNQLAVKNFDTRGVTRLSVSYRYGLRRVPVRVAVQVFSALGSVFRTDQTFELHVTVPGACGNDTSFLGGISGRVGVQYGVFVVPGLTYVIGPNARTVNAAASYSLPPYVFVNNQRVNCAVRVTETSAFDGCTVQNAQRDSAGRAFVEATWASNSNLISAVIQYNCTSIGGGNTGGNTGGDTGDGDVGQSVLSQGWVTLPFNGASGTTPQSFVRELDNAITSLWRWDALTQSWDGWSAGSGSLGLDSLRNGDVLMAFVPLSRRVSYSPVALLDHPPARGNLIIPPGYSFQIFGGETSRSLPSLLGNQASLVPVLYRWDVQAQNWNYFLAGRQPLASVPIPWFDVINPGDVVFIFNTASRSMRIPWS